MLFHSQSSRFARPPACQRVARTSVCQRLRRQRCNASSEHPPAGDSSSHPDSNSAGDATPSTSYQLPWEDEQPKQLPASYAAIKASIQKMDNNQLQTALGLAIAAEDYELAASVKARLQQKLAESDSVVVSKPMDWSALGVPGWLADRAERLGFMFPTEVQRRATPVILSGADTVIASETGSGKTAAFLVPAVSQLDYPPDLFPDDLEGPQLLLLVPSFELGVQACLMLFKLWGGNISSRTPGDPANMFSYTGPPGIKVRGLLNDEEIEMAVRGSYLKGVHALVATPDMALALMSLPGSPLSFQDLRVIVVDEMDAQLDAYPASFGQLMDAAVHRHMPPTTTTISSSSSSTGAAGEDADAPPLAAGGGSPEDNLSKLKALLERQQQEREQRQRQHDAADKDGGAAGSGSASLAAAAARLEGLLTAPAAAGADQKQPQKQQGEAKADAAATSPSSSSTGSSSSASQLNDQQSKATAAAAVGAGIDDDTPLPKPQVVLVGATISDEDIALALNRGWVEEPVVVRVGDAGSVPAGLKHRAIVVPTASGRLAGLVSSLRKDLSDTLAAADAAAAQDSSAAAASGSSSQHAAPVRVIIFAQSEAEAQKLAEPLRAALWGDHMLSVLLPSTGAEPIKALHAFRDRVASLLLATPSAARGLDLPAVSHVYSVGLPADATEYTHRAGRAGRIGSTTGGEVCTVVTRDELEALKHMVEGELKLQLECVELDRRGLGLLGSDWAAARQELLGDVGEEGGESASTAEQQQQHEEAAGQQLETARKGLEDLFNLL